MCLGIAGVVSSILYYKPILGIDLKEAWQLTIGVGAFVHFVFSFNPIPSGSMLNTLEIGDRVIVNNFIYGFGQYNFPFGLAPISGRILAFKKPKRGEIVVFRSKYDIHKPYVKRLVGMPGDKLQAIGGGLYIIMKHVQRYLLGMLLKKEWMVRSGHVSFTKERFLVVLNTSILSVSREVGPI